MHRQPQCTARTRLTTLTVQSRAPCRCGDAPRYAGCLGACGARRWRRASARRGARDAVRLAPSPLDEDFLLPDRGGDGFGERPPPRRRETHKLCYKCGERATSRASA